MSRSPRPAAMAAATASLLVVGQGLVQPVHERVDRQLHHRARARRADVEDSAPAYRRRAAMAAPMRPVPTTATVSRDDTSGQPQVSIQPPSTLRFTPFTEPLRSRNSAASATSAIVASAPVGVLDVYPLSTSAGLALQNGLSPTMPG
jgi:hypothetical protein